MITLRVVATLYLLSGAWCAYAPDLASEFLGYSDISDIARAEFFTVYGGLQAGLGIAMLCCSLIAKARYGALLFSTIFSLVLAAFRLLSSLSGDITNDHLILFVLEISIALAMVRALQKQASSPTALNH